MQTPSRSPSTLPPPAKPTKLQGILLAAGRSRRFGADKRLAPIDGIPMALVAARTLALALPDPVVVVAAADEPIAQCLTEAGFDLAVNPHGLGGMGKSLATGVAARLDASGWVIALADMPWVRLATYRAICAAAAWDAIVAPGFCGRRGHPVAFGGAFRHDLVALDGDEGARWIVKRSPHALRLIDSDDPGTVCDVDHPNDLDALRELQDPGRA
ncbi:MAG: NTP transferase domain-containing protein [Candidatus Competibacterales bacterium]